MKMAAFSFRKDERLKRKKQIDQLFASGKSFFIHPFKVFWLPHQEEQPFPVRVLFSVSRRNIRKAVHRNRIKRLVREAYRQQKHELYECMEETQHSILLAIIYTGREMISYNEAEGKINRIISRLIKELKAR